MSECCFCSAHWTDEGPVAEHEIHVGESMQWRDLCPLCASQLRQLGITARIPEQWEEVE